MPKREDQILLGKIRQLDPGALEAAYDRYSTGLYAYAFRLLGDSAAAEDCVSEVFSRLLKALHHGRGPGNYLQAYLYRIAHNWITDQFRRGPPAEFPMDEQVLALPDTTGEQTEWNIRRRQVRAAIRRLTADQRQAVVLRFFEGWENAEIAQAMNRSVGAVKALQQRGIAALRRMLLREEEET
jgi:RNA polymerase sigma-70 factor (ECF subfamily)